MNEKFFIGYDAWISDMLEQNSKAQFIKDSNTDFTVCGYGPTSSVADECEFVKDFRNKFATYEVDYVINNEFANWEDYQIFDDGYDWCNTPDGCHRLNLPDTFLKTLAEDEHFLGIMYDEMEHVIINRNVSLTLKRKARNNVLAFPITKGGDIKEQGSLLRKQIKEFTSTYFDNGVKNFAGEHVWPVLFHTFASAGIIPNFKSQKESYSNVQFAIAAGAALEYNLPLWNCVDLWFRLTFPGHSPNEMYHNLLFSYLVGVERCYVEGAGAFFTDGKPNEYAETYKKFSSECSRTREYSVKDYKPEIGIIKYDDSYWGQCDPVAWKKILLANKRIKPDKIAREFTNIFNLITHGETCKNGLSWSRISPWSIRKHKSFCSMNSVAVFDDVVAKDKLTSLKLCFLCGYHISENTLKSIAELVKENGLTVVTTKRFLPEKLQHKLKGGYCEITDGKGKWIVTKSFLSRKVKLAVKPFIGKKGEMRFTFGNKTVKMKISKDGESFDVL